MFFASITLVLSLMALSFGGVLALLAKAHKEESTQFFSITGYVVMAFATLAFVCSAVNVHKNHMIIKKYRRARAHQMMMRKHRPMPMHPMMLKKKNANMQQGPQGMMKPMPKKAMQ